MADVPLPEWVKEIRPHQQQAVDDIIEAFETNDVVFLDAPTGSGKTLIAEMVRRELKRKCLYVCSDKALMQQFAKDFPYAKLLMGKANYETQNVPGKTADDCTYQGENSPCWFCDEIYMCPYQIAKAEAMRAPLAVTNTAFLMTEANYVGKFSGQPFIVADEADTLEKMLMGFVEYHVSKRTIKEFGMEEPGKGIHKPTLVKWLLELSGKMEQASRDLATSVSDEAIKEAKRLNRMLQDNDRVIKELRKEIDKKLAGDSDGKWLRNYDEKNGGLHLKPVMVDSYGTRTLWRHGRKWLLMSATIISADEMADSLGLPLDYATVKVPMTFPVENRPVILAPVANVVYSEMKKAIPKLAFAIHKVMDKHPTERILVHTVSYYLAKELMWELRKLGTGGRPVISYQEGRDKDDALKQYKQVAGSVLLAPSMGRGIDLPGDLCRVQVIAKVPYLSMGDTQVSRRTHLPGGEVWYAVQAIRDVVQMTGRGVRNKDDHAVTYIFDQQFSSNLWRKHKAMFPDWWQESVITNRSAKEFMS
jgi:Rad3-related DNA helicase